MEFDFEVKLFQRCGLYLYLFIKQSFSFHLIYYFPNNLLNSNFHYFSKIDKNIFSYRDILIFIP